jgi:glyoxylase-like metal-dependent hydrolase (beta-lactamase superfamily II)
MAASRKGKPKSASGGRKDAVVRDESINISDIASWRESLQAQRPVLVHLNGDTTWLVQLPVPEGAASGTPSRTRFNILIDPWLQGPQSDVAAWFSTQWHVVAPSVGTMAELNAVLASLEDLELEGEECLIDAIVVSHEFTDHCHQATLEELPKSVPIFATDEAAKLIRSWKHFDNVTTTPGFSSESPGWEEALADPSGLLPPWVGIGRVITAGNALYYHSAVLIVFDLGSHSGPATRTRSRRKSERPGEGAETVIYSPHGINATDLECVRDAGIKTLALLHGLHDVRIWMTAQLNLGALNGIQAAQLSGAKYWIATHDETKRGGGLISWFLQRTAYTLRDAVEAEEAKNEVEGAAVQFGYRFVELGSGDALLLA